MKAEKKNDRTRNQRQARRREHEKKWLRDNGWRSWEALHTALMNGSVQVTDGKLGSGSNSRQPGSD